MTEPIRVVVPGHVYLVPQLGTDDYIEIRFVRRSGGAIQYKSEWPGLQTQTIIRVAIDRTKYLNNILPCTESEDAIQFLRQALFAYEARAWRRKQEEVNRKQPAHDDTERPHPWREYPYADVPFDETEIELRPIGPDGHIIITEEEINAYYAEMGRGTVSGSS